MNGSATPPTTSSGRQSRKSFLQRATFLLKAAFASVLAFDAYQFFALNHHVITHVDKLPEPHTTSHIQKVVATRKQEPAIPQESTLQESPLQETSSAKLSLPRVLAIVFPQFHQDPLNDKLWGTGFTDWDNLRAAPPKNRLGLDISRPTELGYYDLRNATVRRLQGDLAKQHGIDGFVYHHYWFYDHDGPNLHAPLINMLQDGYPNVSFCFNWCDGTWYDTWLGKKNTTTATSGNNILQKQFFPPPPNVTITAHYNWLKQFFHHPNYILVQGQPVLMVYQKKPSMFPIVKELRKLAIQDGFPGLYLVLGMSFTHDELFVKGRNLGQRRSRWPKDIFNTSLAYPHPLEWMERQVLQVPEWCLDEKLERKQRTLQMAGILTSFDNTPRRTLEEANLWSPDEPHLVVERFYQSVYAAVYYETCCVVNTNNDGFVVINSMNEWAEGMSLEPSTVFGRTLLEVVRDAKRNVVKSQCKGPVSIKSEVI